MIFQSELTSLETELSQLELMLTAKRQQLGFFQNLQSQADECLERLSRVVNHAKESTAHGAIASLKTAVLTLFADGDGGTDYNGGNQPNDPTPDTDPTPGADDDEPDLIAFNGETGDYLLSDGSTSVEDEIPPLTYAQAIKNRCSACWGYEVTTKRDIKEGFVNRTNFNFMEAVNLERNGREFYQTVENYLNKLYYNGQSCDWASPLASPLACQTWEDAPLTGQHCTIIPSTTEDNENKGTKEREVMYVQLVKVSDAIAYQRKHDGEIICTYIGFRTKALAQSWKHFFEAITSSVELRQALRLENCKWEIKAQGVSIKQIERFTTECDFTKSYRQQTESPAQAAGIEPPSGWGKPQPDPMTCILGEGDVVEVISHRHPAHHGLIGTVEAIANFSELPLQVLTPRGSKGYQRDDLKLISKAEKPQQPYCLQAGTVLMGNRIVTTGNYAGLARRNAINNFRTGLADKLAAIELMKSGLSTEEALAAVSGTDPLDIEF